MVVGDDAQSIYGFRGASHENIMAFPAKFPGCRVIKLQDNYRSQQKILDVANAILSTMRNKYDKHLVSANGTEGEKPQLLYFRSADEEGSWIAHKVLEMRDEGVDLHKQAVLFRSSYISIPLQMELNRCNIPYQVYGGMKFYETAHVKDLFSYLKVIHNFRDEISWSRMLSLIEGIGPKTCERLTQELFRHPIAEEALEKVLKADQGHKYSRELARLAGLLEKVGKENSCFRQFELCLEYYKPSFKLKFDDWTQRENDLDALKQMSSNYASLRDFLADFTLEPPERGVAEVFPSAKEDEKPLTLSTIHSAKGLEWETVYLIGLIDGILPVSFALANEDSIEEEQRLFYVAVTRAKRHLYLSVHHESRGFGMNQFNRISRFIENPRVLSCLETGAFTVASSDTDDEYDIDL
jgi:DNA helicase-2/ATP-dependent DNA helicase PcrA